MKNPFKHLPKRNNQWDVRLAEYVTKTNRQPFQWGKTNCGALIANAIDAMYQTNIAQQVQNYCNTKETAQESSNNRLTKKILDDLGFTEQKNIRLAQTGDVIYSVEDDWECCHLHLGRYLLSSTQKHGVFVVRAKAIHNLNNVQLLKKP